MKQIIGGLVLVSAVAGCTESNPVDSVKTQIESRGVAAEIADNVEATRAVQSYQGKHGENPPSLEALEASEGRIKRPPGFELKYDPATAKIWFDKK